MKKPTIIFLAVSLISIAAVASGERLSKPGDPQKPESARPMFSMTDGYFSFFTLFTSSPVQQRPQADTSGAFIMYPRIKEDTRKPK
jgi:hypothetical protein